MRTNKEGGALPAAIVSFAVRELEQWLETLPATREITPAEVAEAARYFVGWLGASRAVLELLREARSCLGLGLRELEGSADCVVGHLDPEVLKAAGAEGPDSFVVGPGLKDTGPITVVGSFAPGVDWVPASAGASAGVGGMIADPAPVRDARGAGGDRSGDGYSGPLQAVCRSRAALRGAGFVRGVGAARGDPGRGSGARGGACGRGRCRQ
jgi:hypothetical protein